MSVDIPYLDNHNFARGPSDWHTLSARPIVLRLLFLTEAIHGPRHPFADDCATPAGHTHVGLFLEIRFHDVARQAICHALAMQLHLGW